MKSSELILLAVAGRVKLACDQPLDQPSLRTLHATLIKAQIKAVPVSKDTWEFATSVLTTLYASGLELRK